MWALFLGGWICYIPRNSFGSLLEMLCKGSLSNLSVVSSTRFIVALGLLSAMMLLSEIPLGRLPVTRLSPMASSGGHVRVVYLVPSGVWGESL